jgi:DNA (cytosine-5)-methyltransferase 1
MHLFAGAGGGLLADLILGHTPVVAVEWEPYPCQVLRERAAEGWFPELVVWEGDVRNFDPSEYADRVDCIHAGFPCQDISVAGKQAGVGEGTRSGLYREVLRIAGAIRPQYIFLENVAAIKSNGLEQVVKDLAIMGYDSRWLCIRASDVGAPHHRDRWFALAYSNSHKHLNQKSRINATSNQVEGKFREKNSSTWQFSGTSNGIGKDSLCGYEKTDNVADTDSAPCERDKRTKRIYAQHTNIDSASWWQTEPNVGRVVDGVAARVDKLKAIGNGQVPLQVATAFTILASE